MASSYDDKGRILKWVAIAGLVLGVFGSIILLIGYKEPSPGRIFTIVSVLAVSAVCLFLSTKMNDATVAKMNESKQVGSRLPKKDGQTTSAGDDSAVDEDADAERDESPKQ